jgi:hypothetical protein
MNHHEENIVPFLLSIGITQSSHCFLSLLAFVLTDKTTQCTSVQRRGVLAPRHPIRQQRGNNSHRTQRAMHYRKPPIRDYAWSCSGLLFGTIIVLNIQSTCLATSGQHLEERMQVVRKVLKEVPLIDG